MPEKPSDDQVIRTLQRDLEGLRQRVDGLDERTSRTAAEQDAGDDLAGLRERLDVAEQLLGAVNETTDEHTEALKAMGKDGSEEADTPAMVCWLDVTDPEQARVMLVELGEWITDVLSLYAPNTTMDKLESCWAHHPDAVQVLLDLRAAWTRAYSERGTPLDAFDVWGRNLPTTDKILDAAMQNCSGQHQEQNDSTERPVLPSAAELTVIAQQWVTRHDIE